MDAYFQVFTRMSRSYKNAIAANEAVDMREDLTPSKYSCKWLESNTEMESPGQKVSFFVPLKGLYIVQHPG